MSDSFDPVTGARVVNDDIKLVSDSFTRPADTTAYTSGDAVNNSTSAPTPLTLSAVARKNGGGGRIRSVRLITNNVIVTGGTFRVYFLKQTITPANDNAAATVQTYANRAKLIGYVDLTILTADTGGDSASVFVGALDIPFTCPSDADDLFAVIVAKGAYTPTASQTFELQVGVQRDPA